MALSLASAAFAQVYAPNSDGVSMGHLHLNVKDIAASKKFWVDQLGGSVGKLGTLEAIKFPGVLVLQRKADATGGTDGSLINHVGFRVRDLNQSLTKWKAGAVNIVNEDLTNHQATLMSPDGVKVEITEDKSLTDPIANDQLAFSNNAASEMKTWYAKLFGPKVPGVSLSFTATEVAAAPTKGRALDHIGFEVKDLEAFCKKLEASGIKLDAAYRRVAAIGLAVAFFTDPWGTYIELTEGLSQL